VPSCRGLTILPEKIGYREIRALPDTALSYASIVRVTIVPKASSYFYNRGHIFERVMGLLMSVMAILLILLEKILRTLVLM
jgi:hypothetical protein